MRWEAALATPDFVAFWTEHRVCVLGTVRPDGRPHAAAVGAVLDFDTATGYVITRRGSRKVANIRAAGAGGAEVTVTQVEAGRWSAVHGVATVHEEPDVVADAERRYAQRYRVPAPNPLRVALHIQIVGVVGRW